MIVRSLDVWWETARNLVRRALGLEPYWTIRPPSECDWCGAPLTHGLFDTPVYEAGLCIGHHHVCGIKGGGIFSFCSMDCHRSLLENEYPCVLREGKG